MENNIDNSISLRVKDFRIVKSAKIDINGITVLSGINASGKSTISKLLYYSIFNILNFNYITDVYSANKDILEIRRLLSAFNITSEKIKKLSFRLTFPFNDTFSKDLKDQMLNFVDALKNEENPDFIKRNISIMKVFFNKNDDDYSSLLENLKSYINDKYNKKENDKINRVSSIFFDRMKFIFNEEVLGHFELYEYGNKILDNDVKNIPTFHSIENVVYIDTPVSVDIASNPFGNRVAYWGDLNFQMQEDSLNVFSKDEEAIKDISNVINGNSEYIEDSSSTNTVFKSYVYNRKDGKSFNLIDCATGIKAFSIIQMLLKKGRINKNTICIIDEPEVHLHPQWIVEYAKLIVFLNKNLGVRFLISTHNPDMVSALRNIAEKEKTTDKINFYIAEEEKDYMYSFRDIKLDINPIFKSFNKSLDKIDEYGEYPEISDDE